MKNVRAFTEILKSFHRHNIAAVIIAHERTIAGMLQLMDERFRRIVMIEAESN